MLISLSIIHDGWVHVSTAVGDLINRTPLTVEGRRSELPQRIRAAALQLDWVADAEVRFREEGHLFFGELFVVPSREDGLTSPLEAAARDLSAIDWRIGSLILTPVRQLDRRVEGDR